jgi:transcription elongation factor GreA
METEGRRKMSERILAARELGDLKENAEYHIAKEDQALMEAKIQRMKQRLRSAVVVEVEQAGDRFTFGRTAEVLDEASGKLQTWTVVGPTEADLREGRLSSESPVAQALLDHKVGDTVQVNTPGGTRSYVIQKLVG